MIERETGGERVGYRETDRETDIQIDRQKEWQGERGEGERRVESGMERTRFVFTYLISPASAPRGCLASRLSTTSTREPRQSLGIPTSEIRP